MTILGAILAGGAARRFGEDKAAALIGGRAMIAHVAERLSGQCDALVVVGRDWPGIASIPDRPRPGLGPLGGLAGALVQAQADGHEYVLTSGCDLPDLPGDLVARLSPAPAVVQGQPLLGLWRADGADALIAWLEQDGDRAMRGWIAASGARRVPLDRMPVNINTPADMAAFAARAGWMAPD
jgi:molybdopterin-guanine dinucleotide biosynthesis protein A